MRTNPVLRMFVLPLSESVVCFRNCYVNNSVPSFRQEKLPPWKILHQTGGSDLVRIAGVIHRLLTGHHTDIEYFLTTRCISLEAPSAVWPRSCPEFSICLFTSCSAIKETDDSPVRPIACDSSAGNILQPTSCAPAVRTDRLFITPDAHTVGATYKRVFFQLVFYH